MKNPLTWLLLGGVLATGAMLIALRAAPAWDAPPDQQIRGQFWREHWYERGAPGTPPGYDRRFRVNAPETSLHPEFGRRPEARENGLMLIRAEEHLFQLTAAEFYAEVWGGHPGTANKRIMINGRSTYFLPRVGTEEGHCTYFYPTVSLRLTDLVNGFNAIQFAVDQGSTFWGHMLVDNAALRVALADRHPDLVKLGLDGFAAQVQAEPLPGSAGYTLSLECPAAAAGQIASVDFQGWYHGYDENGDGRRLDWHGFTKHRRPVATLGVVTGPPYRQVWDTTLLPAQTNVAVRAVVRFAVATNLIYLTAATAGLEITPRPGTRVFLLSPHDVPVPFWSRANQRRTCTLDLDLDPARIEAAELHMVTWTGGAGAVRDYFTLNGVFYPVAEGERHEVIYSRLPINPQTLRRGLNRIELRSDTDHHGIEIFLPGPALMIRYRTPPN